MKINIIRYFLMKNGSQDYSIESVTTNSSRRQPSIR